MAVARSPSRDEIAGEAGPALVVWREGTRTVVWLRGEQDTSTADDLAEALAAAGTAGGGDVVVDLSDVQFMDSTIITVLARGQHALKLQARALMLRSPSRFAQRLLDVCGLVAPSDGRSG
jgi:anti-sigma B factor antagonist